MKTTVNDIPHMDRTDWLKRVDAGLARRPANYFSMYSSIVGGIVTDPALMAIPVDDHLVHRGDGVFETLKCVEGGIYNLRAHLERLTHSAEGIRLAAPFSMKESENIIVQTVRAGGRQDVQIRVLLSRGPGSLGVNPNDCPEPQLYVITAPLVRPFMETRPNGARIGLSRIPPKPPPFAALKTCNYLPNALMAGEGSERGLDFMIGLDADAHVLEGPTENLAVVTDDGWFVTPDAPHVLPGTTLDRVMALAGPLVASGMLKGIRKERLPRSVLAHAREIFILGTSHDVVAVTEVEDERVGTGAPGPVFAQLSSLLRADIRTNKERRTEIF